MCNEIYIYKHKLKNLHCVQYSFIFFSTPPFDIMVNQHLSKPVYEQGHHCFWIPPSDAW